MTFETMALDTHCRPIAIAADLYRSQFKLTAGKEDSTNGPNEAHAGMVVRG